MRPWKAELAILSAVLIGAITYPVVQWTLQHMDLLLFHIMRFPLLALLFFPLVLRVKPRWQGLWKAALPGVFLWLGIMTWSYGVMITDQLGSSAFITSLQSILAPFVARMVFGTRIMPNTLWGLGVAAIGLALLTLENGLQITPASRWMLLSAVLFSMYLVTNSQFSREFDSGAMSWAQFLACAILSLCVAPFLSDWHIEPSWWLAAALFFMVVISTGLRFFLMVSGQKEVPADRASILVMMEPVLVAVMAWSLLEERMNPMQLTGSGLILLAIFLARPKAPA